MWIWWILSTVHKSSRSTQLPTICSLQCFFKSNAKIHTTIYAHSNYGMVIVIVLANTLYLKYGFFWPIGSWNNCKHNTDKSSPFKLIEFIWSWLWSLCVCKSSTNTLAVKMFTSFSAVWCCAWSYQSFFFPENCDWKWCHESDESKLKQ